MTQYLLVANGVIEGVVLWDGVSDWTPPDNFTFVVYEGDVVASAGYRWNGHDPVPPPAPPLPGPLPKTTTGTGANTGATTISSAPG